MIFAAEMLTGWEHREAVVNGVRLHYVEAGSGPLVVLLHGFPCSVRDSSPTCGASESRPR